MDKEDMMNLLQTKMEYSQGTIEQGEVITGLRVVIALIEIRESIDKLTSEVKESREVMGDIINCIGKE